LLSPRSDADHSFILNINIFIGTVYTSFIRLLFSMDMRLRAGA
jgi:hypothetical protein